MLELNTLAQTQPDEVLLGFMVTHNVGTLRTTLTQELNVTVTPSTGRVCASLELKALQAISLEDARRTMALWCDRMAAALRYVERQPGEVPRYTRALFDKDRLPKWLQAEFDRIVVLLRQGSIEHELFEELTLDGHPLAYVPDAFAFISHEATKPA